MKHYTTIEQSKKLLKLGLNSESADMHYLDGKPGILSYQEAMSVKSKYIHSGVDVMPCWSLEALLEAIPQENCTWALREEKSIDIQLPNEEEKWTGICDSYLDAAYNIVVWLLENDYIKKN